MKTHLSATIWFPFCQVFHSHTHKEGTWNKGAHVFLRTNWSPSDRHKQHISCFCFEFLANDLILNITIIMYISTFSSSSESPSSVSVVEQEMITNIHYFGNQTEGWTKKLNTTTCLLAVLQYLRIFVLQFYSVMCNCFIATVLWSRTSGFKDVQHLPNTHISLNY